MSGGIWFTLLASLAPAAWAAAAVQETCAADPRAPRGSVMLQRITKLNRRMAIEDKEEKAKEKDKGMEKEIDEKVGASTPAAGKFTTLEASGEFKITYSAISAYFPTSTTQCGILYSTNGALAANGEDTLTMTNPLVTTYSVILATANGCFGGDVMVIGAYPAAGSFSVKVTNRGATACTSIYVVSYLILNGQHLSSPGFLQMAAAEQEENAKAQAKEMEREVAEQVGTSTPAAGKFTTLEASGEFKITYSVTSAYYPHSTTQCGILYSVNGALAANGEDTLTITNPLVTTESVILATANGCFSGDVMVIGAYPAAGSFSVKVTNRGATSCTSIYAVSYLILNGRHPSNPGFLQMAAAEFATAIPAARLEQEVGASTPAAGKFTTLEASGEFKITHSLTSAYTPASTTQSGILSSKTGTLAANGTDVLAITNPFVTPQSVVLATANGCFGGDIMVVGARPGAGSFKVMAINRGASPCSSIYVVSYLILN